MRALLQNLNALVFLAGLVVLYDGLAGFSRDGANVAAGVIMMAVAVWPFLSRPKPPKG